MEPQDRGGSDGELGAILLLTGLAALFVAGLAWGDVSAVDSGGSARMNILIALAYRIGGANFAVGVFAVPGIALVLGGVYFLRKGS